MKKKISHTIHYFIMKRILGLDLGTTSIGWAVVNQAVDPHEQSNIVKLGVRVNPLSSDEKSDFEKGKSITTTANRTLKRAMRRNLQRYKLRRSELIRLLKSYQWISDDTILAENENSATFETYRLRSKAAIEEVTLEQFARVLLMINKKRGYKSSRKMNNNEEDGQLIDGMDVAKALYDQGLTPGQFTYQILQSGKKYIPTYYRSDLQSEFNLVYTHQAQYYPDVLNSELQEKLKGRDQAKTKNIFSAIHNIKCAEIKERKMQSITVAKWRTEALTQQLDLEQVVLVLASINGDIANSSGYLGAISDHSKELYFNHLTVGQYLMQKLDADPHFRVRNRVFYRQDYLNEFETIWECQKQFHPELTDERKEIIRDTVIFYQRKLKSQKKLISFCELESKQIEVKENGKPKRVTVGSRVSPKSAPIFQQFKIWSVLNNLTLISKLDACELPLDFESKKILAEELQFVSSLEASKALKLIKKDKDFKLNYKQLPGNTTSAALMDACKKILERTGHDVENFNKMSARQKWEMVKTVFDALQYKSDFLQNSIDEDSPMFRLWHLLYSYEGDNSNTGNFSLIEKIHTLTNIPVQFAAALANVKFEADYGSLSAKAMKRILPFMVNEGKKYSEACELAGYRHSKHSITKEDNERRELKSALELLPKNSLRNPVVEKILNQMVHVVNQLMADYGIKNNPSDKYGHFDEIHIELARELKQTMDQRKRTTDAINSRTKENDAIKEELKKMNVAPSRNNIIKYRLWKELKPNEYKTLYTNTYVPIERLFSKDFEVEHIIPQAKLFDDSFNNKTIETHEANLQKADMTARDFVMWKYPADFAQYKERVINAFKQTNPKKLKHLLMEEKDIPSDFLNRDLSDSQYIAKKAKEMLHEITRTVVVTTGSITMRLREDWQLVDVMKELNWDKYHQLGLTESYRNNDGHQVGHIKDWTKRNDHRHHAMDALTIAFTSQSHIQLLNNLNARGGGNSIYGIMYKELTSTGTFKMPMPNFRAEAKNHIKAILVSIKAKNKVVTPHHNRAKNSAKQVTLTPRDQLHNETIYGKRQRYVAVMEKVGKSFTAEKIATVCRKDYREALLARLNEFGGNPTKAFTGKNSLAKNILWLDSLHTHAVPEKVKTVTLQHIFTVRKPITPDLKVDKVIDKGVKDILQKRLEEYGGNAKAAFANLDDNPIWLNEQKGINIKSVTVKGVNVATALHEKINKNGEALPTDFVSTSNNHHIAIFEDEDGNYHERVVSFFDAVSKKCKHQQLPVVDKNWNRDLGWKFLFTMKQNEYFVVPDPEQGFNPQEIDLADEANAAIISPHLFRVQKITTNDYTFRHHLETTIDVSKPLKDTTWKRIQNANGLKGFVKVRVNHVGKIVEIGEYD